MCNQLPQYSPNQYKTVHSWGNQSQHKFGCSQIFQRTLVNKRQHEDHRPSPPTATTTPNVPPSKHHLSFTMAQSKSRSKLNCGSIFKTNSLIVHPICLNINARHNFQMFVRKKLWKLLHVSHLCTRNTAKVKSGVAVNKMPLWIHESSSQNRNKRHRWACSG